MNIFFLSMCPKEAAKWHANIHVVKMIVETAQLLCNVHHRQREHCLPPYQSLDVPYRESAAGHRKLGSMVWVTESLGNYRWAVQLGLALCDEYNSGRGRAAGKTSAHKTQRVLEWLRDNEPRFECSRLTPVTAAHLAMPDQFKSAPTSVEAYHEYYYSKRLTMPMCWPPGRTPPWWRALEIKYNAAADGVDIVKVRLRSKTSPSQLDTSRLPKRARTQTWWLLKIATGRHDIDITEDAQLSSDVHHLHTHGA